MKIYLSLAVIMASISLIASPCFWGHSVFAGSAGCTDEGCGIGCGERENQQVYTACYTNGTTECCKCSWVEFTCDCPFGQGWGRDATRIPIANSTCVGLNCSTS